MGIQPQQTDIEIEARDMRDSQSLDQSMPENQLRDLEKIPPVTINQVDSINIYQRHQDIANFNNSGLNQSMVSSQGSLRSGRLI